MVCTYMKMMSISVCFCLKSAFMLFMLSIYVIMGILAHVSDVFAHATCGLSALLCW